MVVKIVGMRLFHFRATCAVCMMRRLAEVRSTENSPLNDVLRSLPQANAHSVLEVLQLLVPRVSARSSQIEQERERPHSLAAERLCDMTARGDGHR